jgi:NAD(P)-dependent dehydrogenase (short-subunit alcohol dehydrogenase family)
MGQAGSVSAPAAVFRTALVTGSSSGIGRAAVVRLHRAGFGVYATARRPDTLADLAGEGIHTLALDVTDDASMRSAVDRVSAERGQIDVLVNAAGFELVGAVEEIPPADVRRQFDTNVFGLARLTQLVLPGMRRQGYGRIINVSSIFGRFAMPGFAYYAATKHAVAAFSDALRLEVAAFGIRVVQVEPTAARTGLGTNAMWADKRPDGPYGQFHEALTRWHAETFAGPPHNLAGRLAVSADDVAKVITRAATARRPRTRYPVGTLAHGLFLLRRWLPTPVFDASVGRQFPAPSPDSRSSQAHEGS